MYCIIYVMYPEFPQPSPPSQLKKNFVLWVYCSVDSILLKFMYLYKIYLPICLQPSKLQCSPRFGNSAISLCADWQCVSEDNDDFSVSIFRKE